MVYQKYAYFGLGLEVNIINNLKFKSSTKLDFIAMGRLCIDLNANEIHRPLEQVRTFTKYLGGSPANIAVAASQLGLKTGFIGRVSDDQFGRYIINYLRQKRIDTSNIIIDKSNSVTGLAFTEIKSPKESSILMYRDNVADLKLNPKDIKEDYIKKSKTLLISGTALSKSPSREAVFLALEYARKNDVVVFFDIDYRPYSWNNIEETSIYYSLAAEKSDVIIGTKKEFDVMGAITSMGETDDTATAKKWFEHNAKIVVIKHGKEGSTAFTREGRGFEAKPFPAKVVKAFGAGDSYAGAFIYGLINNMSIPECLELGSASASLVISSHSCSEAMPTLDEIQSFIEKCKKGKPFSY